MTDLEFDFLVLVARTNRNQREYLLASPNHKKTVKALGNVAREVLNALMGHSRHGHVAKAWLALVTRAAAQCETKTAEPGTKVVEPGTKVAEPGTKVAYAS